MNNRINILCKTADLADVVTHNFIVSETIRVVEVDFVKHAVVSGSRLLNAIQEVKRRGAKELIGITYQVLLAEYPVMVSCDDGEYSLHIEGTPVNLHLVYIDSPEKRIRSKCTLDSLEVALVNIVEVESGKVFL